MFTNIVLAINNKFIKYADTLLKSIFCHVENANVFILHSENLESNWTGEINRHISKKNSKIILAQIPTIQNLELVNNDYISHLSKEAFLRFHIERLFPFSESNNWLYLDADTIVNGDITGPFHTEQFKNTMLMAVEDTYVKLLEKKHLLYTENYFNTGVLYINSNNWKNMESKLLDFAFKYEEHLVYADQDAINNIIDNYISLPIIYNFQAVHMYRFNLTVGEPIIFHFTGKAKPWNAIIKHKEIYEYYKNLTWEEIGNNKIHTFKADFIQDFEI